MATDLITKLEEAGEGSRELDCRIHALFDLVDGERWTDGDLAIALEDVDRTVNCPHYTASVDAALALAERVHPGVWWLIGRGKLTASEPEFGAQLMFGDTVLAAAEASTPALALCAAILRASEQERGG